jgi:hypothetical protein
MDSSNLPGEESFASASVAESEGDIAYVGRFWLQVQLYPLVN